MNSPPASAWLGILLCSMSALAQPPAEVLQLRQTIPLPNVEGRIDHMAANGDHTRLAVAALGNNTVEILDLAAGKRISTIHGLKEPQGVLFIPGGELVVTSGQDGKCRTYDRAMKLVVAEIPKLEDADNVRYDDRERRIYVGWGAGAIAVMNPMHIDDIRLDGHPESFQFEKAGTRMFVNVPDAGHVAVIDRQTNRVVARWTLAGAGANFPMALDETNHRLFVGCRKPARLLVLDTESGKTVQNMNCCGDTDDIFYDPASKQILLSGGEGCIDIFEQVDPDHYSLRHTVKTAPGARTSFFVPQTRILYLAVPHRGSQHAEIRVYAVPTGASQ
jgi:DNA-binding beta-propeller fold protein YncE